ncbi:MAG: hypothetical protein DLM73_09945 [Chthoniobacterales bacterium]|nr:MAG: hypothetical protein DLM73_09945 [Chthoniobacterales bacterium]
MHRYAGSLRGALALGFVIVFARQASATTLAVTGILSAATSSNNTLLIVLLVVGATALCGLVLYADYVRSNKIEAFARSLGVPFRRKPTGSDNALPIGCSLENKGRNHIIANVLEALHTDELVLTLFDYQYTVGFGRQSQNYNQTIARMQAPLLKLPYFNLYPETIFAKMGKVFGASDINFSDAPEFSDNYILRGGDEAALRAIFTPALRQFLEPLQHLSIEGADDVLFLYRWQRRTKPRDLAAAIEQNKRLLALLFEGQQSMGQSPG